MTIIMPESPKSPRKPPSNGVVGGGFILAAVVILVLIVAGLASSHDGASAASSTASDSHTVVYRVEGTSVGVAAGWTTDLTYSTDGSGSVTQENEVPEPSIRSFTWPAGHHLLAQISAQNNFSQEITCSIEVDGVQVKSVTASGEYAIAHCVAPIE